MAPAEEGRNPTMPRVTKVYQPKLFENVASQLREAIIGGELRPGDKLLETELAEQFGVSRGPIREAIRELARDGLVIDLPRRGTLVSAATLGDLIELYDVREALESFTVKSTINRAKPTQIARLTHLNARSQKAWHSRTSSYADQITADLEFHGEIFRIAGNSRMLHVYDQLRAQTAMLLRTAMVTNPTLMMGGPPDEIHQRIRDAVAARDTAGACNAIAAHYEYTRERLFDYVSDGSRLNETDGESEQTPASTSVRMVGSSRRRTSPDAH